MVPKSDVPNREEKYCRLRSIILRIYIGFKDSRQKYLTVKRKLK